MRIYSYENAVKEDVREYINNEIDLKDWRGNKDGLEDYLNEVLWLEDSITGNASGSYTFDIQKANEYLCGNWDLLNEVQNAFGELDLSKGAEYLDVSIRCYLLNGAISSVIDEFEEELEEIRGDNLAEVEQEEEER